MSTNTKIAALAAALLSATAARAAPAVITYSGFLTDAAGNPVTSAASLTFRFYAAASGGTALGSETVSVVPSSEGFFSAVLGSGYSGSVAWGDLFAAQTYMSVQFGSEAEMNPRIQVTSVPSAMSVSWNNVTGRPTGLTCPASQPFVVGEDGSGNPICAASLAGFSCSSGQVMKWNGSAWACGDDASGSGTVTAVTGTFPVVSSGGGAPALSLTTTCAPNQILKWNGTAWACATDAGGAGTVTDVTGTFPVVSSGGATPALSLTTTCAPNQILKWSGTAWGCGDDRDTNTVTNVQSPLTLNAGTVALPQASGASSGFLASGDWRAFDAKQGRTVEPTCPAGQYLRSLAPDGTPTCATDATGSGGVTAVKGRWPIATSNGTAPDVYDVYLEPCSASGEILEYDVLAGWKCARDDVDGGIAADVQCLGCVSDAEITSISGSKVSGTVANATTASVATYLAGTTNWGQSTFQSAGTINAAANPVDWTKLKGVPGGLADGVDADTTYSAATSGGLVLNGTAFSANFTTGGGAAGTATTVARGDHVHYPVYSAIDTPCAQTLATVTTTLTKVGDLGTFTKQSATTPVEITWSSPVEAAAISSAAGIGLYLRVDGVSPVNNGRGSYFMDQLPYRTQVVIHGVFTGLSAGPHTVQVWAYVPIGTATNLSLNYGCWAAEVVVREN